MAVEIKRLRKLYHDYMNCLNPNKQHEMALLSDDNHDEIILPQGGKND